MKAKQNIAWAVIAQYTEEIKIIYCFDYDKIIIIIPHVQQMVMITRPLPR
jgi:hypothetical protein